MLKKVNMDNNTLNNRVINYEYLSSSYPLKNTMKINIDFVCIYLPEFSIIGPSFVQFSCRL